MVRDQKREVDGIYLSLVCFFVLFVLPSSYELEMGYPLVAQVVVACQRPPS